jgi:predicted CXXCH cytochrome family protein
MLNRNCNHPCCPANGPCKKPRKQPVRTRIKPYSKKREKQNRQYAKKKRARFEEGDVCAIVEKVMEFPAIRDLFKGCQYFATDNHHQAGKIGAELLAEDGVKLCRNCHDTVEVNPKLAKQIGVSKSRLINYSK